jgi:phenylalanyl-tRNA synthetase alpha chain
MSAAPSSSVSIERFRDDVAGAADEALSRLASAASVADLEAARVAILGKKGSLSLLLRQMGAMDAADRPAAGAAVNEAKERVAARLDELMATHAAREAADRLDAERVDITLPATRQPLGTLHPCRQVLDEMVDILRGMGFRVVAGPEIEDEWHNFEALNFPPDHPARDMQDTFFLRNGLLPRTHTSPVQIRAMLQSEPPLAVACPGKVYRCDNDVTHSPMFLQLEGLVVDDHTSFADLKGTLQAFAHEMFGPDISVRLRPSFFPFTEPSAEIDIQCIFCRGGGCRVCSQTGWMEVGGSGMVHPNVLRYGGIDPEKWQGYAFGMGIDRIAMLRYGIDDIRLLYENDQRFLRQF